MQDTDQGGLSAGIEQAWLAVGGGLSRRPNVSPADIALSFPVAETGKRRRYHVPDRPPISAELMPAEKKNGKRSPGVTARKVG